MARVFTEAGGGDATLLPSEELVNWLQESDGSEGELAPPQPLLKSRGVGFPFGLAFIAVLLVFLLSGRSGASLRNGNVDANVQLNGVKTSTSLYLIKHTFKSEDDVKPWWEFFRNTTSDKESFKKWIAGVGKAGFANVYFIPTAAGGPFYCLWEAEAGKTKADMEAFINKNKLSPAIKLQNEVMEIPLKLSGGALPGGVKDYFSDRHFRMSRRLATDKEVNEQGQATSSFYLIKHTFKKAADVKPWWKNMKKLMSSPKAWKEWVARSREAGFDDPGRFFPTAEEGPFYCLWEAKAGKSKTDMETFIDTNKLSPATSLHNEVMEIPLKLLGGYPPFPPTFH